MLFKTIARNCMMAGLFALSLGSLKWASAANMPTTMPVKSLIGKAVLMPASGSKVHGWVKFSSQGKQLRVWGEVNGLTPGKHGFHIHEYGDCATPDAISAGGHFAGMTTQLHGNPTMPGHHSGDMGNIEANASGIAKFDINLSILMNLNEILGRGLIVHEKADDFKTQPSGAAGGRVACGIIGVSNN